MAINRRHYFAHTALSPDQATGLRPIGWRTRELADLHPDKTLLILVDPSGKEREVSWATFEARSNQVARLLEESGAGPEKFIGLGLGNCEEHYYAAFGAWKAGACVLPLNPRLSERERQSILELAEPAAVVAGWPDESSGFATITIEDVRGSVGLSAEPLPDRIPQPGKAIGSGGSTGRPKIIVDPQPFGWRGDATAPALKVRVGQTQLVAAALFHNAPFGWSTRGILCDHTLVVMEKFDAELAFSLMKSHKVNFLPIPPIIMQRLLGVQGIDRESVASVESIMHTGAPCPRWVKRGWIELIGGDRVHEGFGATENVGATNIRGDEWLEHEGSVGRPPKDGPFACDVRILDEAQQQVPAGEIGEIFMKPLAPPTRPEDRFRYIGSDPPLITDDGFVSVGDMGWLDDEGWLYLADRRVDMIVSGGINVYPAEIEGVLSEDPGVSDVVVIGVPDDDWGLRVHAIVLTEDALEPVSVGRLDAHARKSLSSYKVPKSYEFVDALPRDEAGKIRRTQLAQERTESWSADMLRVGDVTKRS